MVSLYFDKGDMEMCEFCESNEEYKNHYGSFKIFDFGKNKVISCEIDKCPPCVDCSGKDMNVCLEMIIKFCPKCGRKLVD